MDAFTEVLFSHALVMALREVWWCFSRLFHYFGRDLNISQNTGLFTTQFGTGIHDPKRLKCEVILYNVEPVANISLEMASAHIS